jgi:ribokinase
MTTPLIVLGSASRDYTVVVARHPQPGETLLGGDIITGAGGKGANQAVAAARSGLSPVFLGCFGDDSTGVELIDELSENGVDVTHVTTTALAPTGVALITVVESGENSIVVAAGANARLDADATARVIRELAGPGTVALAQLEIPLETVRAAAAAITGAGGRFVLNLSPSRDIPADLLAACDPLVVNESEAAAVSGRQVSSVDDARDVAALLVQRCRSVVVTLGGDGVVWADAAGVNYLPAEKVAVVDTTGAGDAFAGALAARLAQAGQTVDGASDPVDSAHSAALADAVALGIAAGARAVQHVGAQPPR